uniref:Liprin-beta-1-like n=1 Tax=Sinocyclocheilus rhinocerous TaxID=307959 RepID=A0A673LYH8_9TELE
MMSDASDMLAAALEQMDGIIAGSKALDYSNGIFDCQSPTSPFMGSLRALNLLEDLRGVLELMDAEERESLRCQIPDCTADSLVEWLHGHLSNGHISITGDVYQDRLNRLESDKESLELLCRSALETQKLELMAEVSNLKLKLTAMEKERLDFDDRFGDSEGLILEINELRYRISEMESERLQYEKKLKSTKVSFNASFLQVKTTIDVTIFNTERDMEVQKMKKAMESLMAANEEKDRKIEELRQSLMRYKKVQEMVMSAQGRNGDLFYFNKKIPNFIQLVKSFNVLLISDRLYLLCGVFRANDQNLPPLLYFSSDKVKEGDSDGSNSDSSLSMSTALSVSMDTEKSLKAFDEFNKITTLPPKSPSSSHTAEDDSFGTRKMRSSFGRGFFKIKGGKRTASAPNLGMTSILLLDQYAHGQLQFHIRATAGPRLGWSCDLQNTNSELDAPFARWSREQVCDWMQEQGLGLYVSLARQWVASGQTLLQASQQDLERELGIKHPLHRKKLQLALQALGSEEDDNKGKLDYHWVTRWLDDIGLPQYKTQFDEGRVDGRMLHYMTVDDLLSLKVGSVLHHLSIKRAIQVLRLNNYDPNCLRRRPSDENNISPAEISQWTNHRVMEWLRSVDLAEYAPNLRGSGVHGGLMVLEPRFNVETMALLLNIPANKTLLRRHLATHFNLLVGSEAQQLKQECLENPDYTLLTATAKVKPHKLAFGGFGRKKKQEDSEEYVCPMDVEMPKGRSFQKGYRGMELQIYDDDLDRFDQMEDSEGTVRQIGVFSEGINNLTVTSSCTSHLCCFI